MKQMDATKNGSASDAELHVGETVLHMPIEKGTEGERAMDVSALLKNAGVTTLDYGYANTASTHPPSPSSTAITASCVTAATQSSSWRSRRPSSRSPTC